MYAWGVTKDGQTGLGTKEDQTRPAKLESSLENVVSLSVGPRMTLALTSEGDLYSWGTGLMGELGLAYITRQETPAKLSKASVQFKAISVGYEHCLAVSTAGDLYVWGANDLGQLGTGELKPLDRPTKLKLPQKFVSVAAGTKHSMALSEHGFVFTWGGGWAGQNGDAESKSFLTPHLLSEDLTFKYISAGDFCSVAINNRGKVYTWGSGAHGRLGHGDVKPQLAPKVIDHLTKMNVTAVKVIAGYDHMLLLSDKGELWTWGAGANGETAQNTTVRRMLPHPVLFQSNIPTPSLESPPEATSQQTSQEASNSEAGSQNDSQGESSASNDASDEKKHEEEVPAASNKRQTQVIEEAHGPFVDIGTGRNFSIAINQRGECYSFGNARNGVLGNGKTEGITALATRIESQVNFTKVFVSRDHVIALGSGEGAPIVHAAPAPANPEEESAPSSEPLSSH